MTTLVKQIETAVERRLNRCQRLADAVRMGQMDFLDAICIASDAARDSGSADGTSDARLQRCIGTAFMGPLPKPSSSPTTRNEGGNAASCDSHRGWISHCTYDFIAQIVAKFGRPTVPIVIRRGGKSSIRVQSPEARRLRLPTNDRF
jgi:hypothetical protein